jgi:ElaB/YqjD/DUF883 family membrane-anchored ribosome-binding protein
MTQTDERSLNQLKRDTEQTRAGLTDTVEQLRTQVSETASDIRHRISPDAIKAEVSDYFRSRREQLIDRVTKAARDNPMQAVAVGASVAYPLLRVIRSIPVPVLMVGAGLFLASSKTGQVATRKASKIASDVVNDIGARAHDVLDRVSAAQDRVEDRFANVGDALSASVEKLKEKGAAVSDTLAAQANNLKSKASAAKDPLSTGAESLKSQASTALSSAAAIARDVTSGAASTIRETAGGAIEYGSDTANRVRTQTVDLTNRAGKKFVETIQENPLAVAGIGLAIGALIASCLPPSDIEKGVMGDASTDVKNRVRDAASQGFDAAKDVASGVYGDVAQRLADEGLDASGLKEASRGLGDRVRKVAESTVAAAFENPTTNKTH